VSERTFRIFETTIFVIAIVGIGLAEIGCFMLISMASR